MLRFYSELDDRVKTLGYVIKCFAKVLVLYTHVWCYGRLYFMFDGTTLDH